MDNKKIAPNVILGKDVVLNDFINLYGCTIGNHTKRGMDPYLMSQFYDRINWITWISFFGRFPEVNAQTPIAFGEHKYNAPIC